MEADRSGQCRRGAVWPVGRMTCAAGIFLPPHRERVGVRGLGANAQMLHVPSSPPYAGGGLRFSHGTTGTNLPSPQPSPAPGKRGEGARAFRGACHAPLRPRGVRVVVGLGGCRGILGQSARLVVRIQFAYGAGRGSEFPRHGWRWHVAADGLSWLAWSNHHDPAQRQ